MKLQKKILIPPYFGPISHWMEIYNSKIFWDIHQNYEKQSYRNRTFIHSANGVLKLTVPIKHSINKFSLKDSIIDNSIKWQDNHWKSIKTAYSSSPYFEYYKDSLEILFNNKFDNLLELNFKTFEIVCSWLDIKIHFEMSSKFNEKYIDDIDLRHLINHKLERKINLKKYIQVFSEKNGFINDLSIMDLIFNEGPNSLFFLK